jgi:hypothetical protein
MVGASMQLGPVRRRPHQPARPCAIGLLPAGRFAGLALTRGVLPPGTKGGVWVPGTGPLRRRVGRVKKATEPGAQASAGMRVRR